MRSDGLGDVAERVDGGAPDGLLVRLEQLQQLEADAHPLARRHVLGSAVGNPPHQVDAVLLHLLVTVLEDGRESRQQVLDGRRHLVHADDVDDGFEGAEDGAEHLGVLLAEVLVEDDAQVAHELLLLARLHDGGDAADEVGHLLAHLGRFVVQTPQDGAADLRQVRLDALAQRVDDGAEAVEHHHVFGGLLLEGVQDAVDELLLEARVDVGRAQVAHDLLHRLHHHFSVLLVLVLQSRKG